jgi:hypothetical protein
MSAVGNRYRETANEDVTVDTSVRVCVVAYVTVNCRVQSRAESESPINPVFKPTPVYSHSTRDNIISALSALQLKTKHVVFN